jgi:hypothetical protein
LLYPFGRSGVAAVFRGEANVARQFRLFLLSPVVALMVVGAGCGSDSSNPKDASADARDARRDTGGDVLVIPGDAPLEVAVSDVGRDGADAAADAVADAGPDGVADRPQDSPGSDALDAADALVDTRDARGDAIDAPLGDAPTVDAATVDVALALDGPVALAQVAALLASRCVYCHGGPNGVSALLDLSDHPDAGQALYDRLLGPIRFEPFCGELDGGTAVDAGARHAIVPNDLNDSFLYLKILGQQPDPGAPPSRCGARMPRVVLSVLDGGAVTSTGCDQADGGAAVNCLSPAEIAVVRDWILQGAPQ